MRLEFKNNVRALILMRIVVKRVGVDVRVLPRVDIVICIRV